MEIKELAHDKYISLIPVGDLDANSSIHLDEKIRDLIDNQKVNIHVDCSQIPFMSSAGLGVFISYLDELKAEGGQLVVSHLAENVKDVFDLLGLNQLVPIAQDADEVNTYFS